MLFPRFLWPFWLVVLCAAWSVGGSTNINARDVVLVLDDSIQMLPSWSNAKLLLEDAVDLLELSSAERDR
jgi:hypothetical protein